MLATLGGINDPGVECDRIGSVHGADGGGISRNGNSASFDHITRELLRHMICGDANDNVRGEVGIWNEEGGYATTELQFRVSGCCERNSGVACPRRRFSNNEWDHEAEPRHPAKLAFGYRISFSTMGPYYVTGCFENLEIINDSARRVLSNSPSV
jgi:hypothetical protein